MKRIKIHHLSSEMFEQTINKLEDAACLFVVVGENTVVAEYAPLQGIGLFKHLVAGYNGNCLQQSITKEDREMLENKRYVM